MEVRIRDSYEFPTDLAEEADTRGALRWTIGVIATTASAGTHQCRGDQRLGFELRSATWRARACPRGGWLGRDHGPARPWRATCAHAPGVEAHGIGPLDEWWSSCPAGGA